MAKAVCKTLFPTMVIGSLPRPQWIRELIENRKNGYVTDKDANRVLDHAILMAIRMQEQAGLDFISDGEWRRESYVKVFSDAVEGFMPDLLGGGKSQYSGVPYPAVVSKLLAKRPIASEEGKFLRKHTNSMITVAIPSPYTIGRRMWSAEHSTPAYSTREEFMDACIPIIRHEIQNLAQVGVNAIQIDDPWLAVLVDPERRRQDGITNIEHEIELSVKCINGVTEGVQNVFLSLHLCHAHFNRRHGTKGPYHLIMGALAQMNKIQRFAMELATPDAGGIEVLRDFPQDKILGLGVIDHTDTHIETPQEVASRVEKALRYVPMERITLNPDCGFSPSSANPMDLDEAYLKLRAMCRGAKLLRELHG